MLRSSWWTRPTERRTLLLATKPELIDLLAKNKIAVPLQSGEGRGSSGGTGGGLKRGARSGGAREVADLQQGKPTTVPARCVRCGFQLQNEDCAPSYSFRGCCKDGHQFSDRLPLTPKISPTNTCSGSNVQGTGISQNIGMVPFTASSAFSQPPYHGAYQQQGTPLFGPAMMCVNAPAYPHYPCHGVYYSTGPMISCDDEIRRQQAKKHISADISALLKDLTQYLD